MALIKFEQNSINKEIINKYVTSTIPNLREDFKKMYKIFNELNNSIKEIQKISNGLELLNKGINKFKEIIPKFEFKSFEVLQNITKQIIENISSILRENAKNIMKK